MKGTTTLLVAVLLLVAGAQAKKRVMPWMCLERCHENIPKDLEQIVAIAPMLSAVSYEKFNLELGATLKDNGFTNVIRTIRGLGLEAVPMITTAKIEKLRDLWPNQERFIAQVVEAARNESLDGVNIDFEPEGGDPPTHEDAVKFVGFLDRLADALHAVGNVKLSVDIASWTVFWDFALLGNSKVDKVLTMDTYCGNSTLFQTRLEKAVKYVPLSKLGIGLENLNPSTGKPFSVDEMKFRFDLIKKHNIQEVAIWMTPIPDNWLPLIKDYIMS